MKNIIVTLALAAAMLTSACTTDGIGVKQGVGALGGAAVGGLGGSMLGKGKGQLAFTAAGALLGAFVGSEIGSSLDKADQLAAQQASSRALTGPVGETVTWSNPETGNRGTFKTIREGRAASGEYCREFQQVVFIGGKSQDGYGTACRQPDGAWRLGE